MFSKSVRGERYERPPDVIKDHYVYIKYPKHIKKGFKDFKNILLTQTKYKTIKNAITNSIN